MKHKILWQKLHDDTLQWHYYRLTEFSKEPALTSIKKHVHQLLLYIEQKTTSKNVPTVHQY
jgi:hypothetical protein